MLDIQKLTEKHLKKRSFLSYLLLPFSLIYSSLMFIRRILYQNRGYKSKIKIISVGNIVLGGVGKTPVVIFLAKYLTKKGYKVAVSHRGYKGKFEKKVTLISDFEKVFSFANLAGDESYLLAKKLKNIPVISGKNRKLAIKILEKKYPNLDYIILDDSFQHFNVYHNLDIVVFNSDSPFGNGFVIPSGLLREPVFSLKYADIFFWKGDDNLPKKLLRFSKPIISSYYIVDKCYFENKKKCNYDYLKNKKIALISGIGNPLSFEKLIGKEFNNYISIIHHFVFPDHYNYPKNTIKKIKDFIKKENISYLLTTEKDFDKLKGYDLPLIIISIKLEVKNLNILDDYL